VTLNTSFRLQSIIHALFILLHQSEHTTTEVLSFTDSKVMIGVKFTKTGHVTLTTPIRGQSVIQMLACDISNLLDFSMRLQGMHPALNLKQSFRLSEGQCRRARCFMLEAINFHTITSPDID